MACAPLSFWKNPYGDLQTTRPAEFSRDPLVFERQLEGLLLNPSAVRGVWLRLPYRECAALLPVLSRRNFFPHHWEADTGFLVLQAWLPTSPNPTPRHSHVDLGCGALVVNRFGQLLGICERFDEDKKWGVPGGHLDPGEDWLTCGAREATEETGVACVALGICGIHEAQMPWSRPPQLEPLTDAQLGADEHCLRWGSTHTGVYVLCYATSEALSPDPAEVSKAAWMERRDWGGLPPHVRALVASAEASGQLAAAALAAALGSPSAVPIPGLIAASALPLPSRHGGSHRHVFYHATPPPLFAEACAEARLGAAQRILCTGTGGLPAPFAAGGGVAAACAQALKGAPSAWGLALLAAVGVGLLGGYSLGRRLGNGAK